MCNDPIIQEVRKAREEIARKNNYDFDMICKQAIEYQNQFNHIGISILSFYDFCTYDFRLLLWSNSNQV